MEQNPNSPSEKGPQPPPSPSPGTALAPTAEGAASVVPEWRELRPRKLTPAVAERIITAMIAGLALDQAARAARILPETLRSWLEAGRASRSGMLHDFALAVDEASALCEERLVGIIADAAVDETEWAAWILERKFPQRWAGRTNIVVQEQLTAALDKLEKRLPKDVYEKVLSVIASDD